jgi:hypothetical protein
MLQCLQTVFSGAALTMTASRRQGRGNMVRKRGTRLLMEWLDVDPGAEADFNRWYDDEEVGRLAAAPGILNVGRYEAVEGGPKYLTVCELEDGDVLRRPACVASIRRATGASPHDAASHTCAMQFGRAVRIGRASTEGVLTICGWAIARYSQP